MPSPALELRNGYFVPSVTVFHARTSTASRATALSGMTQGVGYVLAGCSLVLVG
jgi:cyanate permease